jgi:catechol 2,3-dioxygenase-like lactoylglutathione lyase family enzyme
MASGTTGDGPLAEASLGEIVVYVNDLAAMRAFYVDTLGLAVGHEVAGALVAVSGTSGATIVLHRGRPAGACAETHGYVQFLVADIEACTRALADRGVDAPVERRPYGTYARFRDPEGNVVGLEQARGARAGG